MLPSAAGLLLATPLLLAPAVLVFALLMGTKPAAAVRACITIAVAMLGLNLIVWLMWSNLSEAAGAAAEGEDVPPADLEWAGGLAEPLRRARCTRDRPAGR